jgi:hypothetical protein
MNIFTEILSKINKEDSRNFLFLSHFHNFSLSINNISNSNFTKYKYFILKNFIFAPTANVISRQPFIDIFNKIQRKYLALLRFKNIVHFKVKKHLDDRIDLQFNNLDLLDDKYKITLINNNVKYQFSIFDLIKIINTALSYEYRFFPDPTTIKNPWDNNVFTNNNLYNIYFFIKKIDNIHMPLLFFRFFQSNFCIKHFLDNNQLIIKNFIINNCRNLQDDKKIYYIRSMLNSYNQSIAYSNNSGGIHVDNLYPDKKLILVFDEYLKMYLSSKYSYESDIRIKNRLKLHKLLKLFKKNQPIFGRKIICQDIIKLYYISNLHYNESQFICFNENIPKSDVIFIEHKAFVVDFIPERHTEYSVFPMFKKPYKQILNTVDNTPLRGLFKFIKEFKLNKQHNDIIKEKGYDIIVKNTARRNTNSIDIGNNLFGDNNDSDIDDADDDVDDSDMVDELNHLLETEMIEHIQNYIINREDDIEHNDNNVDEIHNLFEPEMVEHIQNYIGNEDGSESDDTD